MTIWWDEFSLVYVKEKPYVVFVADKSDGKYMTTVNQARARMKAVKEKHPERLHLIIVYSEILLAEVIYRRFMEGV